LLLKNRFCKIRSMKNTILSGMRPTGALHLGHYFGVLNNWVALQNKYHCYYMVADWHALTDKEEFPSLKEVVKDMVITWMAAGIDPKKTVIFRQSEVKEHAELEVLLSIVAKMGDLQRIPTYKDASQNLKNKVGVFLYPLLQAADILLYRANAVPIGEDQIPHIEYARVLAQTLNKIAGKEVVPKPKPIITEAKRVPGTDGKAKMSKSLENTINLKDTEFKKLWPILSKVPTDPQRVKKDDPGNPAKCPIIYPYAQLVLSPKELTTMENNCRQAKWGCLDCKRQVAKSISEFFLPFRQKYAQLSKEADLVEKVLKAGAQKAQKKAEQTLSLVRPLFGL